MGDYGSKDFYRKPGPRLFDSEGVGPLSDVVNLVRGLGVGVGQAAADTARTAGMGGITVPATPDPQVPKMVPLIPGVTRGEPIGGEQYQGIYGIGGNPAKVAAGETKEAAKPHPMAQYKDIYDFAEKSKPEELKAFIERNKDNPDLKGLGYIETIDPTTKKLRIEKVISRPEAQGIGPMTIDQATAYAHLKSAQAGIGAKDIEERKLAFEIDKFAKSNDMKDPLNFMKLAASIAPKRKVSTPQEDGTTVTTEEPDANAGVKMLEDMGYKPPSGLKSQPKAATMPIPKVGDVVKGYKFKGGNPADKKSWEKA